MSLFIIYFHQKLHKNTNVAIVVYSSKKTRQLLSRNTSDAPYIHAVQLIVKEMC